MYIFSYTNIEFTFAFTGGSVQLWHDLQRGLLCMQHAQVHCLASCWQVWLAAWLAGRPAPGWQGRGLCGLRSYRLASQSPMGCWLLGLPWAVIPSSISQSVA